MRDAIEYSEQPENIGAARINGFEMALSQEWNSWISRLGLALIDPRNRENGHTLPRRARRTLNLDVDRQFDRFAVGATWQAASSSYNDEANSDLISGYAALGLRGSWTANHELKFDLKLDNVLDKQYSRTHYSHQGNSYGNREEGHTWLFSITWTPVL